MFIVHFKNHVPDLSEVEKKAVHALKKRGLVNNGEYVILTRGEILGVHGKTNMDENCTGRVSIEFKASLEIQKRCHPSEGWDPGSPKRTWMPAVVYPSEGWGWHDIFRSIL